MTVRYSRSRPRCDTASTSRCIMGQLDTEHVRDFAIMEEIYDGDSCSSSTALATSSERNLLAHPYRDPVVENNETVPGHPYVAETTISGKPYPVPPNVVKFVRGVPKTHTNHTYRDFTNSPIDRTYDFPASVEQMTFHEKIYHLLSFTNISCRHFISWCCRGRAFEVLDAEGLEGLGVLRCYFGYNCIKRFRKQLNNFQYKRLVKEANGERYYSEFLLQDMPHLLQYSPPSKNCRWLLPDPDNEPDFDLISHLFPLPSDRWALVAEARILLEARGCYISDAVYEMVASRPAPTQSLPASDAPTSTAPQLDYYYYYDH